MKIQVSILFMFLLLFGFITGVYASETTNPPDLAVIYTGNGEGHIEPAGCCSKIGGMARRATKIKELREKYKNVIVLDSGDYLWKNPGDTVHELRAEHIHKSFINMGYDAINIADGEIASQEDFFKYFSTKPGLPIITSNITLSNKDQNIGSPYIIKQTGNIKTAVIGLVSPELAEKNPDFTISDPIESIKKYLPEIKTKADVIILMSHMNWKQSMEIAKNFPDIDIIVVGHDEYKTFDPEKIGKTLMVKNASGGGLLGVIEVWTDQSRMAEKMESRLEILSNEIKPLPEYAKLEQDFSEQKKLYERNYQEEEAKKQEEEAKKEAGKYLKMTPQEFMKQMEKENRLMSAEKFFEKNNINMPPNSPGKTN
ncbi:Uncharacterized protein dnl_19380 [Desulfonema limicola]|uniref:Calcineurin-like phosphoesterase domain-containing protein n=1 Tax=Desulfonema limicola TaxID=45656 RepID=A0A975GFV7_9BACT|nr:bifunctional metallophosphatase/5'-nucleotidase [Desulfonema limicola]QTA79662.1 Uncharacterized protein dnl_19380 [Desulfonema limicola]